jgi:hypothetical protein
MLLYFIFIIITLFTTLNIHYYIINNKIINKKNINTQKIVNNILHIFDFKLLIN